MAIYGWMIDKRLGGIPVPVMCMFFQGIAQLAAFTSLNAYILDIMQQRSGEASGRSFPLSCTYTNPISQSLYDEIFPRGSCHGVHPSFD